jgi:4-aminobutyrate aminotransferase-like enzyme
MYGFAPKPAPSWLVLELRKLGILLGTDGPDHNVIKFKPPLVVSEVFFVQHCQYCF